MRFLHRLASVVRWMVKRKRVEADLDDELRTFVEMAAADQVREGATPAEARRLAALQLGGVEQAKERVRTARPGAWLDAAGRDVRYGVRQVRRDPAFSAIAIATLALGIGGIDRDVQRLRRGADPPLALQRCGASRDDLGLDGRN